MHWWPRGADESVAEGAGCAAKVTVPPIAEWPPEALGQWCAIYDDIRSLRPDWERRIDLPHAGTIGDGGRPGPTAVLAGAERHQDHRTQAGLDMITGQGVSAALRA
jgi:hypothetical protein